MDQRSFAEGFAAPGLGRNRRLERIAGLIDWSKAARIARLARPGETGRPPYDALKMTKALILAQWYDLSDPALEEALLDRLSFRRFCGFALEEETPDETTICRFRASLAEKGLAEKIFAAVLDEIDRQGFVVRRGAIIDATLIEANLAPPRAGAPGDGHPLEKDAAWTRTGAKRRAVFGYKAHIATDETTNIIRAAMLTPANVSDTTVADDLVPPDVKAVWADKGYAKKARREALKARRIKDRIMRKSWGGGPRLTPREILRNRLITPIRARIERVFAVFKRLYRWRRARYRGLVRNGGHLMFLAVAYNLRRAEALAP